MSPGRRSENRPIYLIRNHKDKLAQRLLQYPVNASAFVIQLKTLEQEQAMKTRQMLKPIVIAAAMAITAPLYAAPDDSVPEQPDKAFEKLDTDRDGFISRDEAAKRYRFVRALSEADDNRDGRLDREEFVKAQSIYDRMRAGTFVAFRLCQQRATGTSCA
ncbi:MAG: EF-hand domain-containing protein [Betaproteobacteria bacterium]|nr:EF-hand domain-containing protein [Betaproteobacteria bacterium]